MCIFFDLCIISIAGIMEYLEIKYIWHIILGILGVNGFISLAFLVIGPEVEKAEKENEIQGRHWVWDKFDNCDPDLSKGHYEYN